MRARAVLAEQIRARWPTKLFLEGRNDELVTTLRDPMAEAAAGERFGGGQLREAIRAIDTLATGTEDSGPELGDRRCGLKVVSGRR